jgi:hypothetical protein
MESSTFGMQKAMPEDDGTGCSLENKGGCKEYNPNLGEGPIYYSGKYYDVDINFDYNNDNYNVDIYWNKGGSSSIAVDGTDAEKISISGLDEAKRNPPMPWPFGSLDHLHWPNQAGK